MPHIYSNESIKDNILPKIKHRHRSRFIKEDTANAIVERAGIWITHGYAFNKQIHINIDQACIENPHKFMSAYVNNMTKWHRKRSAPFVYFWVFENVDHVFLHAHLLIHTDLDQWCLLSNAMTNWLPFTRDDNDATKKHKLLVIEDVTDVWGAIYYQLKGLDKRCVPLSKRWQTGQEGLVMKRRWGMSRG
jgi:hypothetical protein